MKEKMTAIPDEVTDVINTAQDNLRILYDGLKRYKDICEKSGDVGVVNGWTSSLRLSRKLFNLLERTRWLIDEHNINCQPKGEGKLLSSPEEIKAWFATLRDE
ncbi:hypothetical protein R2927_001826 [Salmonella enterica]|nr:hypothetical protein [Salmonella enterica]EHX6274169.1 hypothetical protein [Salmonella enterica]ELQ8527413.1 hypothetical protein [Salmonella enterica]